MNAPRSERRGVWFAAASALCFSAKAIFVKLAYPYGVGPVPLLALRMAFSGPVFLVVALRSGRGAAKLSRRDLLHIGALGLLGYYGASFLDFYGLQYISAGLERLILFTYPTLTLLLAVFVFGRPWERGHFLPLLMTWAGVALAFSHDLRLSNDRHAVWLGGAAVFASAICYALYIAGAGEVVARFGSVRASALATCVSSAAVFVHFAASYPLRELVQPMPVLLLSIAMALFSTVLPVFMQMAAIHHLGATRASLIGTLGPVGTIVLGVIVLGESWSITELAGAVLVIMGVSLASRRSVKG